ncbi:hypothetical protein BKA57DRAFT_395980 [Linnemannia elongata]|nr:hypothetical protein BKA57DRAFT_395980 [Linnemannia elongata]
MNYNSEQQYHEPHHNHNHEHEHDHEYDHGSDDESEGDAMPNEMEYYLQRCSICFDSQLDFCLEMCRDQFCRDCFQKYVKEVVSNSWGLDVTKIKCPVCQDPLPLAEWSKYVDQPTLAQYQQYNQPYRSFSRFCNGCDNEVAISRDLMVSLIELFDLKFPEQNDSVEVVPQTDAVEGSEAYGRLGAPTAVTKTSVSGTFTTGKELCGGVTIETVRIPKRTIADRSKVVTRADSKRQLEVKKALVRFSKELLSLEVRPEQWKELQFLHVRWCRWDWCNNCDLELCLQCGVSSHHESETCFEHMRSERSDLDTGTMQWKLANTNPCPNCCILIHRDDGCNKVDCMLCGHRFCWVCREAWDVGCGFFRCRLAAEEPAGEKESDAQWEKHPDEWEDNGVQAADQVETLAIAMGGELPHAGQGQAGSGTMRHDRRRRRSDDLSAAISEKVCFVCYLWRNIFFQCEN